MTTDHHKRYSWPIVRKAQISVQQRDPEWFKKACEDKGLSLLSGPLAEEYERIHGKESPEDG